MFMKPRRFTLMNLVLVNCILLSSIYLSHAQNVVPIFQGNLSLSNLTFFNGQPTQMAWGPDKRLYVMTNGNGVHSFNYNQTTSVLSDEKVAVPNVSGIGIAFHNNEMYISLFNWSILKLTDNNQNGIWGETNLGELSVPIVTSIPKGDHTLDQLQVLGDTLYVGIGLRTNNGLKGLFTGGSFSDFQGDTGFWSGGTGNTWGDSAYGGTISWIRDLTRVSNTSGSANAYPNTILTQHLVQNDTSPYTVTDTSKLTVHSAGTRNPYGLCLDNTGNLWFTSNFSRSKTNGDGTAGVAFLKDALGPDFSRDVQDQLFKASSRADYGYSNTNWREVNPMMTTALPDYHRVLSTTFDNSFNKGPYTIHDPENPDGLGPSSSSDGCGFFYAAGLPAVLQNNIFIVRWNSTITEASPGTHSITYQDLVAVDTQTGKVRRVAAGFSNPLCVLWDGGQNLLIGDYGNGGIYALHVKTASTLALTLNTSPIMIGKDVNLSASMVDGSNTPISGKLLTFSIGGNSIGSASTDITGAAKIVYTIPPSLGSGVKTVTVSFAGDAQTSSSSQNANLTVLAIPDAIGLGPVTAKGGKVMYAGARLITYNGMSIVGKNLDFAIDGIKIGTVVTDNNGGARLYYLLPQETPAGAHILTASFLGDSVYKSVSKSVVLTVQLSNTSVSVYPQSGAPGQIKSLQCRVFNEAGRVAVNRTVTYSIGATTLGTAITNSLGYGSLAYTVPDTLGAGPQSFTVSFAGDTVYNGSTGTGTLTITQANSWIYLLDTTINAGQSLRLPIRLLGTSGNYISGRTISLTVNGVSAGTAVTQSNGVGAFTYTIPSGTGTGTFTMTASFAGDSLYKASSVSKTLTIK